jgi:hypothetical protein
MLLPSIRALLKARAKSKLIAILQEAKLFLRRPENEFVWSEWDDGLSAALEIDSHIAAIERGDNSRLPELELLFAPTGSIQEVAMSSGWGEPYLALAARFDKAIAKFVS